MADKTQKIQGLSSFAWSIAEILRGDFKQSEYGKVILPFVVLRRLDCILEKSKDTVLKAAETLPKSVDEATRDMILFGAAGQDIKVYNLSRFTFASLKGQDARQLHDNLVDYITKFSGNVRDIFLDKFLFTDQLKRLKEGGILWNVFERFTEIDLHPEKISNIEMGYLFEELIRRFSEMSNETAGEHFTPREVIRLIVDLLIANDDDKLTGRGIIRQVYDPACGTGGMLALSEEALKDFNPNIRVELFGQELNGESFGICKSDMLVTGHDPEQIAFGNTLTNDAHKGRRFHYMLSNPPYGVDWKKYQDPIKAEAESQGFSGRFGAGTPRISDGQLLFLQHMISKMRDDEVGSRIGIVMNGSPLFTGGAGSAESEIRRWMFENDWVEAIVALPTNLFYNTDIQTFVWLLTNRKDDRRRGKIQLIDASNERFWTPLRRNLGKKNREIDPQSRAELVRLYSGFLNGETGQGRWSKIFDTLDFAYREIRIERPLRLRFEVSDQALVNLKRSLTLENVGKDDLTAIEKILRRVCSKPLLSRALFQRELQAAAKDARISLPPKVHKAIVSCIGTRDADAEGCVDKNGKPEPDVELRDFAIVPFKQDIEEYYRAEIAPHAQDAWIDPGYQDATDKKTGRVGYEINFNRHFKPYVPPRPMSEIDETIGTLIHELSAQLKGLTA